MYKHIYQLPWGTVISSLSTCEGGGRDISPSNPLTYSRNRCVSPDEASELTPSGAEPVFLSEQNSSVTEDEDVSHLSKAATQVENKLGHCVITNTLVPWQQQRFCLFLPEDTCSRCHNSGQDSSSTDFPSIFVLNTQYNTFGNQISSRGIDKNALLQKTCQDFSSLHFLQFRAI